MSFQTGAMQFMGKLKNPVTDKIERDLNQARYHIDLLDMLHAKTKNNLDENEVRFIEHVLRELKMNFVDELSKDKKEPPQKSEAPNQEPDTTPEDSKASDETGA